MHINMLNGLMVMDPFDGRIVNNPYKFFKIKCFVIYSKLTEAFNELYAAS
jgi:hypothetical protein